MDTLTFAFICFVSIFGGFLILVFITREVFNIPRMLRYQKAQLKLLEQIAKANGVNNEHVSRIVSQGITEWEPADQDPMRTL